MAVATQTAVETVMNVRLADIIPTPDNSRVVNAKDPKTIALAESIRLNGVQVPALARPHPTKHGHYDLRAGHRRHVAAGLAGLETMPVIVREMTDDEALRATILENVREPLSPIQEAGAIERMQARGWTAQQIAETLGISTATVAKRRNLLKLSKKWRQFLEAGEDGTKGSRIAVHNWPPAYFELIARLPEGVQDGLIKDDWQFINHHTGWTLRDLEKYLDGMQQALKAAPWDLNDAALVKGARPCDHCPKRTSAQPDLFGQDGEDRCLDPTCWTAKKHAWVTRQAEAAAKEHKGLILMQESSWRDEDVPKALRKKQLRNQHAFKRVNAGAAGAKPAMMVDGPDAGKTVWVAEEIQGRGAGKREPGQKMSLAERIKALNKRRQKRAVALFREQVQKLRDQVKKNDIVLNDAKVVTLAVAYGIDPERFPDASAVNAVRKLDYAPVVQRLSYLALDALLKAIPEFAVEQNWERVQATCPILEWDAVVFMTTAEAEIKTPKSIVLEQEQAKLEKKAEKPKPAKKAARKAKGRRG